jgi:hypothetical protein
MGAGLVILRSVHQLLVIANIVPSSPIGITFMMEGINSSEALIFTRDTERHNPEDGTLHSYRRECLNSYIAL